MTSLCCPGETHWNIAVFSNVQNFTHSSSQFPNCQVNKDLGIQASACGCLESTGMQQLRVPPVPN